MLMTVLKGDLAVQQSKALIRAFRAMKDYIVENQGLLTQHDYLRLSMQVSDTQQTVHAIQAQLVEHEDRLMSGRENRMICRIMDPLVMSRAVVFLAFCVTIPSFRDEVA